MKVYQVYATTLAFGLLIGSLGASSAQVAGHAAGGPGPEGGVVIGPVAGPEGPPIEAVPNPDP
jgi:hypothetical protein